MALSIVNQQQTKVVGGQGGFQMVRGTGVWSTTDATGNLPCLVRHIVSGPFFTFLQAQASDEDMYVDTSVAGTLVNGVIVVPTTGLLPIGRTGASKTSAIPFTFEYSGY